MDFWKVLSAAPGAEEVFTNRLNEVQSSSNGRCFAPDIVL